MRILWVGFVVALGVLAPTGSRAGEDEARDRASRAATVREQAEALGDMEAADSDKEYQAAERRFNEASKRDASKDAALDEGEAPDEPGHTNAKAPPDPTDVPDAVGSDDEQNEDEGLNFHLPAETDDDSDDDE